MNRHRKLGANEISFSLDLEESAPAPAAKEPISKQPKQETHLCLFACSAILEIIAITIAMLFLYVYSLRWVGLVAILYPVALFIFGTYIWATKEMKGYMFYVLINIVLLLFVFIFFTFGERTKNTCGVIIGTADANGNGVDVIINSNCGNSGMGIIKVFDKATNTLVYNESWSCICEPPFSDNIGLNFLLPYNTYVYEVSFCDQCNPPSITGEFTTYSSEIPSPEAVTIGWSSDILKPLLSKLSVPNAILAEAPTAFFLLGNIIYIDSLENYISLPAYYAKYYSLFADESLAVMRQNIPTMYMYNDREILSDWASGTAWPWPVAISVAWRNYAGRANPRSYRDDVHYFNTSITPGTCFFVADVRQFRSPANETMLGEVQLQDFMEWLGWAKDACSSRFFLSPVPFSVTSKGSDGWSEFPDERSSILSFLQAENISLFILSGGNRAAAAIQIAQDPFIFEVSASPFDAYVSHGRKWSDHVDDEHVIFAGHGSTFYGTARILANNVTLTLYRGEGIFAWSQTFIV